MSSLSSRRNGQACQVRNVEYSCVLCAVRSLRSTGGRTGGATTQAGGNAALEATRTARRRKRLERAIQLLERRGRRLKSVPEHAPTCAIAAHTHTHTNTQACALPLPHCLRSICLQPPLLAAPRICTYALMHFVLCSCCSSGYSFYFISIFSTIISNKLFFFCYHLLLPICIF